MRNNYLSLKGYFILLALSLQLFNAKAQVTYTLNYTGAVQTVNLPAGNYSIAVWGADGGDALRGTGGKGGYTQGTLTVNAPTTYYVYVGGRGATASTPTIGGWNGGGGFTGSFSTGYNGGTGGGGTDIRTTSNTTYANRIIVAGGGGGASGYSTYTGNGGNGGGTTGVDGASSRGATYTGGGATAVAGGTAATGSSISGYSLPGALGIGGDYAGTLGGTAGGGGYYGGGSGHWGGAGGGGSGYFGGVTGGVTAQLSQPGFVANPDLTGNGTVIITSLCDVNLTAASGNNSLSPVICSGQSLTLTTNAVSGYSWSTGATTHTIAVSPTITTTYTVRATSALSCTSSAMITVTVSTGPPSLTVTSSSSSVCLGNTISITATGALNYTITNGSQVAPNGTGFLPTGGINNYTVTGDNGCGTPTTVVTVTVSTLPVTALANTTLVCAGKPATLTASGATTYSWLPGTSTATSYIVSPNATSVYTLTGRTGSCSGISIVTVSTKPNPTLTIVPSTTAVCYGDAANLVANGNATAYAWNTGQTGLSISVTPTTLTLYTATGTGSNNCTTSAQQVIFVNPNPTVTTVASNPVVCSGGSSTLTASGAVTYSWSSTTGSSIAVHPTAGTAYSVTGSYSTGCTGISVISVDVFVPAISASSNTAMCMGSHVTISGQGADTYTWVNNGATSQGITVGPTANTIYTVNGTVTDLTSGVSCPATATVEVDVNPNPTLTAVSDRANNTICNNESAVLTGNGAGSGGTYVWTGGSGIVSSASMAVSPFSNQTYTVTGTDANGCKSTAVIQIQVVQCTGIASQSQQLNTISIYPNPSTGEFAISSDREITLQITNELGQQVRNILLNDKAMEAKVSGLSNGVYFITGQNANGSVKQKIVVMK